MWFYEKIWFEGKDTPNYFDNEIAEYIACGLEHFNEDDGTPIALKALLFNRYCDWLGGYAIEDDVAGFKEWYSKHY